MTSLLKRLFLIIFINLIDQSIALLFSKIFIIIPLTFLEFSFYVYKSDKNISPLEAFSFGMFVDLISWLMVIQVIISQFFCWGAILLKYERFYFYEEFGWFIIFFINKKN